MLRYNKFDPFVVHVSTDARTPGRSLHGDVLLYDCETGDEREVTVTAKVLERYAATLKRVPRARSSASARRHQVPYIAADVERPLRRAHPARLPARRVPRTRHDLRRAPLRAGSPRSSASRGAVVVALYVLKLRRRAVAIPFSPLWQRILRDKEATSLFSKLKRLLSLLLQLALLALLVLALGDPRAAASLVEGAHRRRARRRERVDAGDRRRRPTRLAAAKDEAKKIVRGLGGADRMLVAQMDATVTPLGPMTGDTCELERELDASRATDTRADFARALRFATDALRGADSARDHRRLATAPSARRTTPRGRCISATRSSRS